MLLGYISVILVLCQLTRPTWGAVRVDARLRARETMKQRRSQVEHLRRRDLEEPLSVTELFKLTPGEALEEEREVDDALGGKVERLQEVYKGLKVYDSVVTVRKTKNGELTGDASGTLIQKIDDDLPDTEFELSSDEALQVVLDIEGDAMEDVGEIKSYQYVYIDKKDGDKAKLVYLVTYLVDGYKRPYYIIDASTRDVLKRWQGLNSYPCCERNYTAFGGNEKSGKITYGDMPYCLAPTIIDDICYLENEYVRVVDMKQSKFSNITETASFVCDLGYGDEVNGAYSPAIDAFFHGTVVGKMFEEWFGSPPLKSKIVIRVHYDDYMENAFWNGENCTFGDGGSWIYPLISLDVVGHEIAHGVTEQASSLAYYSEHGGVNEAFSDIIGEAAEDYLLQADFVTGGTIMKTLPYMREFEFPESDNMSISKVDDMDEFVDVHHSSGVFRRVWFVVVKQEGMSIRDAATVFLHANKMYWHSTATFYDCSCGLLMAAMDLGYSTVPFNKAFADIGLDHCDVETHILGLNNNETNYGVTVSNTVNPVFKMLTPEWADTFFVDVTGGSFATWVSVFEGGWESSNEACGEEKGILVAEGFDSVSITNAADKMFYMKFSNPGESSFKFKMSDNKRLSNPGDSSFKFKTSDNKRLSNQGDSSFKFKTSDNKRLSNPGDSSFKFKTSDNKRLSNPGDSSFKFKTSDNKRLSNPGDSSFKFKVSDNLNRPGNSTVSDVFTIDITAGYTCQQNFSMSWLYLSECGFELPDY